MVNDDGEIEVFENQVEESTNELDELLEGNLSFLEDEHPSFLEDEQHDMYLDFQDYA